MSSAKCKKERETAVLRNGSGTQTRNNQERHRVIDSESNSNKTRRAAVFGRFWTVS